MPTVNIKIKGLDKLRLIMKRMPGRVNKELGKGIDQSLSVLERTAKIESPIDTGRLRAAHIQRRVGLIGTLIPRVNYALFVHDPGVTRNWRGDPWLTRTVRKTKRKIQTIIQKSVNRAIR